MLARTRRSWQTEQARQATLELFCVDSTRPLNPWEQQQLARGDDATRIPVMTKADLAVAAPTPPRAIATSSVTGAGLEQLRQTIYERLNHVELPGNTHCRPPYAAPLP